jgi:hypothetical protein
VVAAFLAAAVVGCAGEPAASTSTTVPATTPSVPASTTTPASSSTATTATTTTAAPRFTIGEPSLFPPDPLPGSGGASGSGCPPEGGLLDGVWFGFVPERTDGGVVFDPACFYFGEAAEAAAAEDGEEISGPHYVRNAGGGRPVLDVAPAVPVESIVQTGDGLGFERLRFADWPAAAGEYTPCPGEGCSVWIYIDGGGVAGIVEQYLP